MHFTFFSLSVEREEGETRMPFTLDKLLLTKRFSVHVRVYVRVGVNSRVLVYSC